MHSAVRARNLAMLRRIPYFGIKYMSSGPKIAVVLSGNGVYDGTEIHEACATLSHLTREGAEPLCYAPDVNQMHVVNHFKGEPAENESRNVLIESARIARGNIKPLSELKVAELDGIVFPGGFGAAKNLSDFAVNGDACKLNPDVSQVIEQFHASKKPIALCCIAPVLAASAIKGVTITLGKTDDGSGKWPHAGAIDAAKKMGANMEMKGVMEACVDKKNLIVTSPAFMYDGKFHEIYDGIGVMIKALIALVRK
ncbi:glutamine amidotransferase-like class 1 domain-containing protein 3, mitochondrial [Ischnura elegans]|uniref:glutamine amidotransferase-like class 1 domain-containing protein 3, mitochondrial n=1 Tax=Ischnura elegans TaxID=197161 RepID=UPI001ED8ABBE|nr:glutamine amidotransferase-like class 1 domain-containing protein 3, mitochondrial [Ischnura elegans]